MSLVRKMVAICDKCGAVAELPFTETDPFNHLAPGDVPDGWFAPDRAHHLCPACAEVYKARKAEYDRELKKLAGIKTIEVDI